jgi:hypothetical protein
VVNQILLVGLVQLAAPAAAIGWLLVGRPPSRAAWVGRVLLGAGIIGTIAIAGLWLLLPWALVYLYVALLIIGAWVAWRRSAARAAPAPRSLAAAGLLLTGLGAALALALAAYGVAGRRMPQSAAVELSFPLHGGSYYVANGGSNVLINQHLHTLHGGTGAFRGQSYGVDIVQVSALGLRANGVLPADPARYRIFGAPVYAPCAGRVTRVVDQFDDLRVPQMDRRHPAGNYILLRCGDYDVLLAHLQRASISVIPGDAVQPGTRALARVGNSGNSSEPHLHIHAQQPADGDAFMAAAPVPILFDGNYLVRNQRVRPRP